MANHYRVSPKFWLKARHREWTDAQTTLALYLLTCEHRNLEGLYRLPKPYIAADLGWPVKKVEDASSVIFASGFALYDPDAEMVLIPNALKHQSPSTENQIKGAIAQLERIPRTSLWDGFRIACESHCERLADAIETRWPRDPDDPSRTRARSRAPASSSSSTSSSSSINAATPPGARARGETSRSQAETVECPRCSAPPGDKCMGVRGPRESCHLERHHAVGELAHIAQPRRRSDSRVVQIPESPPARSARLAREAKEEEFCANFFPGVDRAHIRNAARALGFEGTPPTVDAIREWLGYGEAA